MIASIQTNITKLNQKILNIAQDCGRNGKDITLVAVSKGKSVDEIEQAVSAGQKDFGENYVQEFLKKHEQIHKKHPDVRWHFIGHLQKNKAKYLVGKIHILHTLDSLELAHTLDTCCQKQNTVLDCLVQVKLSHEPAKQGLAPLKLDTFLAQLSRLQNLRARGLMIMGTLTDNPDLTKREFALLRKLRDQINEQKLCRQPITGLSMGMSGDYELAIVEGATMVRIGTLIFGERK